MFKIVYNGGFTDPWAGLMAVPEARQVESKYTKTVNKHKAKKTNKHLKQIKTGQELHG